MERNEVKAGSSHLNEKQPIDSSTSSKGVNKPKEEVVTTSVFVNHAEISWHESRRKWVGDQSQQQQKVAKDPIISWSTTYEELLCNNQPFPEPIPLPEMVDFLVDIWHDQGLFD
ncbi:uncharacterized protein LOC123192600 isoform X2 [Mangifera indica]|uniref:uncharacterized protein LOC123192600 isoform X2 n=1 Tax=Mangifera indica TaxID=29780 RepID=UPI001CFAD668|nr:uncharacterized protein LOC123192600 isoform X2 [Mangifera indica]